MKLEQNEKRMLFNITEIPDIFFAEYLSDIPGDFLKIYLYISFLAKYNSKDVKVNDLSKKLGLPFNVISEGMKYLEEHNLVLRKPHGYLITDLQEVTLNQLYKPNVSISSEKLEKNEKNKDRLKLISYLNNKYFQGVMGPTWYNDIDVWFTKYGFDDQVMISLFDYCFNKAALHRNYVQAVAEAWGLNKVKNLSDLENYYLEQEKMLKTKKSIAKKLGKHNGLTQYEEAYIEKWINEFKYGMDVIEIALKRTTYKSNPSFEYINNIITDWHDRNLKTPAEISTFLEQRKEQNKNEKDLKKKVNKANFEQRKYDNLDYLYSNYDMVKGDKNG